MSAHEQFLDDLAMLALGALAPADASAVRAHIAECAACAHEYRRLREVADVLSLAAASDQIAAPSESTKRRVMQIALKPRTARAQQGRPAALPAYLLAAACLAAALVFGILYAQVSSRLTQQNALIADLTSPAAQHFPVARGQVVRSGTDVYIAMRDLSAPPKGKVYQAWTLPAGSKRMAPSVTFVPAHGQVLVRLPVDARAISAVAVSVEPAGGSAQPTSKPLFVVLFKPKA
jgi:anti-sigma-K factor RskA